MPRLRDVVIGSAVIVLLATAASTSWTTTRVAASVSTATPAPSVASSLSGPGFAICSADPTWQRPSADEQRAHLSGDRRFDGAWETSDTAGARAFVAPAVFYDGTSVTGMSSLVHLTGLWNIWTSPATRPKTCWTEQPQLFLFGYEPIAYDAQDPATAVLRVRPATGYREVVLTGPIRGAIAIVADRLLDRVDVPASAVTRRG